MLPLPAYQTGNLPAAFGDLMVREIALGAGFPLRCFQRLSVPDVATRQCSWRNNRITRGLSTPVLSY
ncbi:MAG TPA: hypothetical protein DDY69_11755 [Deltaproteobacteria bacterium]|nr:hypothetical protein [Deltaproteobacteria bacterium]